MLFTQKTIASIQDVVDARLCTSCGACVSAAPEGAMTMCLDPRQGIPVPRVLDERRVTGSGIEFSVCPGRGVPIEEISRGLFGQGVGSCLGLGRYRLAVAARTIDREIMEKASSGGVMTAIALLLLEDNLIDGATTVRFEMGSNGPRTQPYIARNRDDIIAAQGSKYCPTSTNLLVRSCQKEGGRYLFIGTPCQVAALRLAVREDPSLRRTFPYTMASFCGGYRDFRYLDGILRNCSIRPSEVVSFRFRGGGWPGAMRAETIDGRVVSQSYPNYTSDAIVNKQRRCTLCVDGTGLLADFACGDAWIDRLRREGNGWSIILARSEFACDTVRRMIDTGRLVQHEISQEDVLYSQRRNLDSKINRQKKRRLLLGFLGTSCPEFDVELPEGNTSLWRELKIFLLKTRPMLAFRFGWKYTAVGKVMVRVAKRLLRRS
jgi:coenzyme F420 hydrogenase subunit beta